MGSGVGQLSGDLWGGSPHPPRDWQAEALPLALASLAEPGADALPCGLLVACTGAGKSHLLARVAAWWVANRIAEGLVILAAPSSLLVDQLTGTMAEHMGGRAVGQYDGRKKQIRRVTVVCYDSLPRLIEALSASGQRCGLLLMDEAHRTVPHVEHLAALTPAAALGCTATPYRSLADETLALFGSIVYRLTLSDAIRLGYLCPYEILRVRPEDDDRPREEVLVEMLERHGVEGPGLVNAASIPDADACAEALSSLGLPAMSIHSGLAKREQTRRLAMLRRGDLRALVDPALLTEGVDLPWLRWGALRRETKSRVGLVQRCGRFLRLHPGKDRAYILDMGAVIDGVGLSGPDALGEAEESDEAPALRARWRDGRLMAGEEVLGEIAEHGRRWRCWVRGDELDSRASERGAQIAVVAELRRELIGREEPVRLVVIGMSARDQGSHPLPGARAVGEAEGWIASLVAMARDEGIVPPREPQRPEWRAEPMGWAQARALAGSAIGKGLGCLPGEARELAQAIRERPDLTRGAADDLIALGVGLHGRWRSAARRHAPDWGRVGRAARWPDEARMPRMPEGRPEDA